MRLWIGNFRFIQTHKNQVGLDWGMRSSSVLWSGVVLACVVGVVVASAIPVVRGIPDPTGYRVNDWAFVLFSDEEESLEYLCQQIEEETTVEVYVITTSDLEGEDLNRYSYLVFNEWGIGKEDVNNGLLITVYYEDLNATHFAYSYRIEIGRGLEGAITDSEAGRIGRDNMTVWFNLEYFYQGLYDGILELYAEFADDPSVRSQLGALTGIAAFQAWGYENPLLGGAIIAVILTVLGVWVQIAVGQRQQVIIPLVMMGAVVAFAFWWDTSLLLLGYALIIFVGGTITLSVGRRVRSGGGRTEGGGFTYNLSKVKKQ